jgi:hypothetical protein
MLSSIFIAVGTKHENRVKRQPLPAIIEKRLMKKTYKMTEGKLIEKGYLVKELPPQFVTYPLANKLALI